MRSSKSASRDSEEPSEDSHFKNFQDLSNTLVDRLVAYHAKNQSLPPYTPEELATAIESFKNKKGKATGTDLLPTEILCHGGNWIFNNELIPSQSCTMNRSPCPTSRIGQMKLIQFSTHTTSHRLKKKLKIWPKDNGKQLWRQKCESKASTNFVPKRRQCPSVLTSNFPSSPSRITSTHFHHPLPECCFGFALGLSAAG